MKHKLPVLLPYIFLGVLTLCACWLFAGRYGVFGAKVDWISQHSVLPEYFRQQFYQTGDLFPEFAPNLGGGQNIFHYSYYGLYNPIILVSYLFPFIKMEDYLMAASATGLMASVWIYYYWLASQRFSREIRFLAAAMFLLAGPMVYHSCHQIMFVNYMPFLCAAFLGVDRHFQKKKSGLLMMSVFLMVMTSFYFSVGGMLVLALYGISRYAALKETRFCPGRFLKDAFSLCIPFVTAVLMSGLLLVPTASAILGKRGNTGNTGMSSLFLPRFQAESLVYSSYGIGLSTLVLTVCITGILCGKWRERLLACCCMGIFTIPVFPWLLNGGLYVRSKALIPFLPLLCYLTAVYLEKLKSPKIPFRLYAGAYIAAIGVLYCCRFWEGGFSGSEQEWRLLLADGVLMFLCFLLFGKTRRIHLLLIPPVLFLFLYNSQAAPSGQLLEKNSYEEITNRQMGRLISQTLDAEPELCRLEQQSKNGGKSCDLNRIWDMRQWISSIYSSAYHTGYRQFCQTDFPTEATFRNGLMQPVSSSPLYQKLMGVKYLIGKDLPPQRTGYVPEQTDGTYTVYKNQNAAPIAYATDQVISEKDYRSLKFPYNQIALMKYAVTKDSPDRNGPWKNHLLACASPVKLQFPQMNTPTLTTAQTPDGSCRIHAKKDTQVSVHMSEPACKDRTLFYLQFHVKNNCPDKDVSIWAGGIRSRLSARSHIYYNGNTDFTYVLELEKGTQDILMTLGKGNYELSNVRCFLGSQRVLEDGHKPGRRLYQSPFHADLKRTKGNTLQGKIQVKRTGYFITSIPYEPGFEVYVDNEKIPAMKVNTTFLGFAIEKGTRNVRIIYHAPGAKAGKIVTCTGILLWLLIVYVRRCRMPQYIRGRFVGLSIDEVKKIKAGQTI